MASAAIQAYSGVDASPYPQWEGRPIGWPNAG